MEWLIEFRTLLRDRQGPVVMALATVDPAGNPRARNVVCRQIDDDGCLVFTSDARSAKNSQLRATPRAEAVAWFEPARSQFRFLGAVDLVSETSSTTRENIWREMSDSARALFLWPAPGQPLIDSPQSFARSAAKTVPIPDTFELIVLRPALVERLDLSTHPHRRHRWTAAANWSLENLNP